MFKHRFFLGVFLISLSACTSLKHALKINPAEPARQYWLTISMNAGRFYDDNSLSLLDYRPFSLIDDAHTPDGYSFYPPPASLVIPAGTLVKVLKTAYPGTWESLKRPLYSPKDCVWIYLKVAQERGLVSIWQEKTYILVVPERFNRPEQVKTYLAQFFGDQDPNEWILKTPSLIQNAIWAKKPVLGMKQNELYATLGPANKKQFVKNLEEDQAEELWHYDNYLISFRDHQVTKISSLGK